MVKAKAAELGIDCIAIGNIERFRGAPKLMSPLTYFPEARSVIAVAMRIPRGTYRGIEEGTHWHNYTFYSYNKLNSLFRPKKSYDLCCFIEDHGWEAVAHYPAVPEGNGTTREPVAADKVPPDVVCSVRVIAGGLRAGRDRVLQGLSDQEVRAARAAGAYFHRLRAGAGPHPRHGRNPACTAAPASASARATPSRRSRTRSGG